MVAISALLGAAFFCFSESQKDAAVSEVSTTTPITLPLTRARGYEKLVYAATDIRRGVEIREEMLVEKPPPRDGFSIAAIGAKRFVVGKRPIKDIAAGEVVTKHKFNKGIRGDAIPVVFAVRDIPAGNIIQRSDLSPKPWNCIFYEDVAKGPTTVESVVGKRARLNILRGRRIADDDLAQ